MTEQQNDPALIAANESKAAIAAFGVLAHNARDADDCETPEYKAAEERFKATDEIFADTDPTSFEGALEKLRAVVAIEFDGKDDCLGARHLRGAIAYLENMNGAA